MTSSDKFRCVRQEAQGPASRLHTSVQSWVLCHGMAIAAMELHDYEHADSGVTGRSSELTRLHHGLEGFTRRDSRLGTRDLDSRVRTTRLPTRVTRESTPLLQARLGEVDFTSSRVSGVSRRETALAGGEHRG
eukprot:3574826-Prymnesium_polylepis.1